MSRARMSTIPRYVRLTPHSHLVLARLEDRGLDTSGLKADLMARLQEAMDNNEGAGAQEEEAQAVSAAAVADPASPKPPTATSDGARSGSGCRGRQGSQTHCDRDK